MPRLVSLYTAAIFSLATAEVFAQTAPLNVSPDAVQVPATQVFFEQGTQGSRITANVGARSGNLTWGFGVNTPERTTTIFDSAGGFIRDARFTLTLTYAEFTSDSALRQIAREICTDSGIIAVPQVREKNSDLRFEWFEVATHGADARDDIPVSARDFVRVVPSVATLDPPDGWVYVANLTQANNGVYPAQAIREADFNRHRQRLSARRINVPQVPAGRDTTPTATPAGAAAVSAQPQPSPEESASQETMPRIPAFEIHAQPDQVDCGDVAMRTDSRISAENRVRYLRARALSVGGGGPNIFFLSGGFNHASLSYRNEAQGGATQEDSRFVGNIRFGFGRYLTVGGLAAVSFNYEMNAKPPDQVHLCQNHPVNGMTTTPPTLQCDDVYLRGYTVTQTINLRAEWRQYLSRNLAWNPSVTFPWQAREGEGSGGGWGALQMRYLDIDTPFYARFGEDLGAKTSLHFGVRPQMRIWTETRSGSPVELNLSVFLGGSFSLFPL